MSDQTTVLQLVLNGLELGNSISTIDDRIAIQKVVCLAQEAGIQLGYGFNWYVRGPYSPALAADYYQLAESRQHVERDAEKFTLTPSAEAALARVSTLLKSPAGARLARVQWLELLASIAFLMNRYKLGVAAARAKIDTSKPHLSAHFDNAIGALRAVGLVPN